MPKPTAPIGPGPNRPSPEELAVARSAACERASGFTGWLPGIPFLEPISFGHQARKVSGSRGVVEQNHYSAGAGCGLIT